MARIPPTLSFIWYIGYFVPNNCIRAEQAKTYVTLRYVKDNICSCYLNSAGLCVFSNPIYSDIPTLEDTQTHVLT